MGYFDDLEFIAADEDPHCHAVIDQRFAGMYNLQFVAAGRMWLGVEASPERLLQGPAVFWHDPRFCYRYRPADPGGWHHMWVTFRGPRARRIMQEGFLPLSPGHARLLVEAETFAQSMRMLVRRVRDHRRSPGPRCVALLEQLLAETLEAGEDRPGDPRRRRMEALGRGIAADALGDWDFRAEARRMHLSYSHFRRLFRRCLGQSPHQFLLEARVRKAAALLASTDLQIQQVAHRCGYEAAQFSKLFHKRLGLWPRDYRASIPTRAQPDASSRSD
jgi:AraC-like DNA-binding protein